MKTKTEKTESVVKKEEQPNGEVLKTTAKKILLEILVYGETKDKDKIKKFLDNLQEQLTDRKTKHRARVLWYIDEGEKSIEEKKQWFEDNICCKYFVYAHEEDKYYSDKNFVKDTLMKIKKFEDAYVNLKTSGITFNKNKKSEDVTEIKQENENTR